MTAHERTNIVVIITDQQRWDTLGCNGNVFAQTPNVDAMARRGVSFDCALTPYPVCTPARATMWTGVLPHAHGVTHNRYGIDDVIGYESKVKRTIFEPLREAGYTAAYFGKWHLGESNAGRFDIWEGFNSRGGHWEEGRQSFQGGTFKPETQTRHMIDFLRSPRAKQAPFVAIQSFYPPHNPFTAPTECYAPYRGKGVPFAGYYAAVTALDDCVGRITAALEAEGLADDTLVIFVSDHGETFDLTPTQPHKFSCLDTSIRVPLVMCGAGIDQAGARLAQPVGLEDLPPTILDAAGIDVPGYMHGRSLLDLIRGAPDWRDWYYVQSETNKTCTIQRTARTDRWKLILSWDEAHELYDLQNDPEEVLNVYDAPRPDIHDQFGHYEDTGPISETLAQRMHSHAEALGDFAGVELASRVLRQRRGAGRSAT